MKDSTVKKLVIYAITHLVVAPWAIDKLRKEGKNEQEAQFGGHVAAAAVGLMLSAAL